MQQQGQEREVNGVGVKKKKKFSVRQIQLGPDCKALINFLYNLLADDYIVMAYFINKYTIYMMNLALKWSQESICQKNPSKSPSILRHLARCL